MLDEVGSFDPDWMGLRESKADHENTIYTSPCYCHRTTGRNISRAEHKLQHCRVFLPISLAGTDTSYFYSHLFTRFIQGELIEFHGLTLNRKQATQYVDALYSS
jgi:hypothetical protein